MIRSLRRRFIFSAMAAFSILLLILILGVTVVSSLREEAHAREFMQAVLETERMHGSESGHGESHVRRMRPMENPIAYYDISIDTDGSLVQIREKGIWEPDMEAAQGYAEEIMDSGNTEGKIAGFRFRLQRQENGAARLILMDNSQQMRTLRNVLQTTVLLGLTCLVLLFLILLPISSRVVYSYALHIEKQKQFITNAGHEIKTPVAIMLSNLDAMELIQGQNKWSRNIRSQTDRLSVLLQRLLFMSRIDEKSMVLPMQLLDLNAILQAELETYRPILVERRLYLHCEPGNAIRMKGNRESLQQMVHMLLDNAVQYTNDGGEICISMEQKHRRVRLLFANSVEKLPDCPPENLFERFYRGDSARTQSGGGYGIGLSAARAIAEMHQGSLSAEYMEGKTICFTVTLRI